MTDLSRRISGLSAKKQALLAQRLRAAPQAAAAPPAIPRQPAGEPVRLSFAQERLWFLDRWQPGNAAYNLLDAIQLAGRLDVPALAAALAGVVARHAVLRTVFVESAGVPYQVVQPAAGVPLPIVDLAALPAGRRRALAEDLARAEGRMAFDLARGPVVRTRLLRLGAEEHFLVLVLHHVATDLWSFGILIRELGTLYNRISGGDATPLPELEIQYADFAVWQRGWLTGEVLEGQLAFWRRQLQGAPVTLDLPADRPRPAVQGFAGAIHSFTLPPRLLGALKALAQEAGATLFMVAWSAFAGLLARTSGQRDLLLGSPIAGRTRREVERLIGLFINTIVLRADLTDDPTVRDLLGRAREATLGAFAHQELPIEKLVEELQPERDPSRAPLVQALVTLQNAPVQPVELRGLTFIPYLFGTDTAKLDLSLFLSEDDGALLGALEYSTDLFDAARMHRLAGHLQELLAAATADPGRRLSTLPLLSPAERAQLVAEWNDTATAYPPVACLHHLFEAQAERTPDAVAVRFEELSLSYRQLERASRRLAGRLQELGVGPETVVGVLLERSLEMVIALYGVLRAGGAYLPLDPSYPRERLAAVVEDGGPRLVLTLAGLAERVPGTAPVLLLDAPPALAGDEPPRSVGAPDALAYVIFTSGSTGRPKGAMNAHRGIVNRILWMQEAYRLGPGDRVLQKTPFSFDVSVWEFFWPLAVGACLVVARPEGHRDPDYLVEMIAREAITTLHFVPSMLQAFLEARGLERCTAVRQVMASGEELTAETAGRFFERLGRAELHNLYGPTEAAVDVSAWPCRPGELGSRVPIGRPIANLQLHLLDGWEPVPIGVPGELFLGGVGVGRGYLGRPALTAERFVPDPAGGGYGDRLYRTGDLARWQSDGAVEFLGRIDHQVKIRGFRIELGEIEAALAQVPGVRAAVVGVREVQGDRQLVAYLAADAESLPAPEPLRELLRARLPEAMVPAAFAILDALPLNSNGKVDRKALARLAPELARQDAGGDDDGRRTPLQELVAGIWGEVLGLEHIGLRESFFGLGGHSLLASRVISRVRETFGVELSLPALFERPTLAELAAGIEELRQSGVRAAFPPLRPAPRGGPLPLSFAQERLWFLDRLEPGSHVYNIPGALRVEGPLRIELWIAVHRAIVRRHEALRTTFRLGAAGVEQVIADPETTAPPAVIDLTALPGPRRDGLAERLAQDEAQRPFDLERGPLLRATVVQLGPTAAVLLFNMHHVVSDGWSMGVFFREVAALYQALAGGLPPALPALPVQYADYAVWQRSWLQGEVVAGLVEHWRGRLAGAPPVLELPWDRPRAASGRRRSLARDLLFDAELARAVRALGRREQATLFMTLLSTFAILLHRASGQDDLCIGTPVAGRNQLAIEGLVGFFVNTLVIRSEVAGEPTFRQLLARMRAATLDAYQHQDLPFEKLVEELHPERSLAHSPLFQVMFVLQNVALDDERGDGGGAAGPEPSAVSAHPEAVPGGGQLIDLATAERLSRQLQLPGLRLSLLPLGLGEAPFDLVLTLLEDAGGLVGSLAYDAELLDGTSAERLIRQWRALLAAAVAEPSAPWSELPLLGPGERQQLLVEWNDTAQEATASAECLHELFEAQAARTPEAEALVWGAERWTYGELAARSGALAGRLQALGVGPETVVAVSAERSPALVVGLLGILRAGGAYVPLDPGYPRERRETILADSGAALVLVSGRHRAELAQWAPETVLLLDLDELASGSGAPVRTSAVGAENLAYLIYTSGSTGRPKGVAIEHRSAVTLARWAREVFREEDLRGVLFATSINFDLSVFELFVPLAWGGRVILADNALALPALPAAGEVTLVNTVPSALAELVRDGTLPPSVRTVNLAGEPLPRELADRIHQVPGVERLYNLYGPSEDTTYSTFALVARDSGKPSIGRPVDGSRGYVLDRWQRPAAVGTFGELWLGGAGLARGYWGRPDLTAERFVPDPFGHGERLYRTGDLVRSSPNGELEYLGRIDRQVKVRGFRIELGEIESALAHHPGVREAAVVVEERPGDRRLVAFVVLAEAGGPAAEELRRHLAEKLPDYMVPGSFRFLEALPLTPNGKVDRRALAQLAPEAAQAEGHRAPRTPVEELLCGIWAEVLGRERVGVADGFFESGGHSLLATQVVSRVRRSLGVELPVRALFEAPTVAQLAVLVEGALGRGETAAAPPLRPVPRTGPLPLSFAQERLWFLEQLMPGTAAYNIPLALHLRGRLDAAAFAQAAALLVDRHESLRTTFAVEDGRPVQVIAPPIARSTPPVLPRVDLRGLGPEAREAAVRALGAAEGRRAFDLAAGPLLRLVLLQLAGAEGMDDGEHVLLGNVHHIVSDGWSLDVMVRELALFYDALVSGRPAALPSLPIQYADFAAWQRARLSEEALAAQSSFWRERLAGAPALSQLPADRPRPAVQRFRGAVRHTVWDAGLLQGTLAAGRREGATLFMVLLAVLDTLLLRHGGQDDLVVGSPIAGRTRTETEGVIGLFLNTLALRVDASGDPAFGTLLAQVREAALAAYGHQDLPFEKLVEELAPERSLSHAPLFQVLLVLQNTPFTPVAPSGLTLTPLAVDNGASKLDLSVNLTVDGDRLVGLWIYNRDLFDAATVDRVTGHFAALLAAAAEAPGRRLSELPLLPAPERHQLLVEWQGGPLGAPGGLRQGHRQTCLHQLIEEQVARSPGHFAVSFEGEALTYAELNGRANRLAWQLRELGVGPEVRVGICAERSLGLVVGLLAILKAGGAYVPLDPAYPEERLGFMLADSDVPVLLTQQRLLERLSEQRARIVLLDELSGGPGGDLPNLPNPVSGAGPDNLAYMIYTSGSTGRPKGAMNTHRAIVNRLLWMQEEYRLTDRDRVLQKTPFSFDVSVWEFFWPLLVGAGLVVARPGGHQDSTYLVETIRAEAITTLHFVPSMLRVFLEAPGLDPSGPSSPSPGLPARRVIASGEALPADLVGRFRDRLPGVELHNLYGPTEAAVDVTYWMCAGGAADLLEVPLVVPIGRPVATTAIRLVDRHFAPLPIGAPGELCIGGVQLARGYWRRPELTAERFVPDPFADSAAPGGRLYRTGDLARALPDGAVEYLGRIDHQVKIRGFRIELGEIEATVLAHPGVQDAAVVVSEGAGGPRLVALAVPAGETLPDDLAVFLATRLPEYMVPTLLSVAALPLSPNGKVDRKALLARLPGLLSDGREADRAGERTPPRTPVERFLADLWREVLGVAEVGVNDRFFDLGGSSLSGAVLVNRLQRELDEIVHMVVIFDAPTIEKLAAYIVREHPAAVVRRWGPEAVSGQGAPGEVAAAQTAGQIDAARVAELRRLVRPLAPAPLTAPNPPAVFVLSPPRSGSTLLRVLLGGNPRLFAPPELELLTYNTLAEREAAFPGRDAFWLEGAIRTVMEARGQEVEEARAFLAEAAREGWSTQRLYATLQSWIGDRMLVDKTPSYALDSAVLERAEQAFAAPRYLHLIRHPGAMIRSFEEAKLDQLFFRAPHDFARRELAELIWLVSHQNILAFLAGVDERRRLRVQFEELVRDPERVLRGICDFLEIPYDPAMAEPYAERRSRMTDGLHAESRMLGDVKFHQHRAVNAGVAEQWRKHIAEESLGDVTWEVARTLGYERAAPSGHSPLVRLREGEAGRALFLVHPVGGNVFCYGPLAERLGAAAGAGAIYGLQSAGLSNGTPPHATIEEMAAAYLDAIRTVQPHGPYRLAGWSMGGLVAFELARRLEAAGERVALLALLDSVAPGATPAAEPAPAELLAGLAHDLAGLAGLEGLVDKEDELAREELATPSDPLTPLDPEVGIAHVLRRAQELGALPAGLDAAQAERLWQVFRANATAARRYAPGPYGGPVWLASSAANPWRETAGPDLGWGRLAGALDTAVFAGGHYDLLREPAVRDLAARLRARLEPGP